MKQVLVLTLLFLAASELAAQTYYSVPAKVRYPNGNTSAITAAVGDTIKSGTVDTVKISVMGGGAGPEGASSFPVGVMVFVTTADADITGTPDTLSALYDVGLRSKYAAIEGNATPIHELLAVGTFTRTFLFTGIAAQCDTIDLQNDQRSVIPWGEEIRLRFQNGLTHGDDSLSYRVDARVIYQQR